MLIKLFTVLFLYVVAMGIALPIIPAMTLTLGGNGIDVGFIFAVQALGQFLATTFWGSLSDRIGRRNTMMITLFLVGVLELLTAFASQLWVLYILRFVFGLVGGTIAIGSAHAADITTKENRSKGMAVVGISFGLGFTFGPAVGAFSASFGGNQVGWADIGLPFVVAAAVAFLAAVFAFVLIQDSAEKTSARKSGLKDLSSLVNRYPNLKWMFFVFMLYTAAAAIMEGTIFLYMKDVYGFDRTNVGYIFAGLGILTALMQGGVGRIAKRFGERAMIFFGGLAVSIGLIIAPLFAPLFAFLAGLGITTSGRAFVHPGILALTSLDAPTEEERGKVMGALHSSSSLGRIWGPALGGILYERVSIGAPFWVAGGIMLFTILIWRSSWKPEIAH